MVDSNSLPARFLFLRHGETDYNATGTVQGQLDVPLNANGRRQAVQAAELLSGLHVGRIVASDLSRGRETAILANARMGAEIDVDARLRERHFGAYQDKPKTRDFWTSPEAPGIEAMDAFVTRIMATLVDHRDTPLPLFVSHGGFLRACAVAFPIALVSHHYANAVPMEFTWTNGRWSCRMLNGADEALQA